MTFLPENDPKDLYGYEISIWTGYRPSSGTDSKVAIILRGEEADSQPRRLYDPHRPVFLRGSVDSFLLTSPYYIGNLDSIRYLFPFFFVFVCIFVT